ncbi:hypothetical protein AB99_0002 [Escherichia coli 1-182-04_S3_C1]|nr:hypothetical protein AB99_0002 [Escherichia coli 1-182-04_S3_C1]
MMSLWDALRMNMMISYQELVRTFLRIAENNNRRSHRVISGYRPITGNDKRSNL